MSEPKILTRGSIPVRPSSKRKASASLHTSSIWKLRADRDDIVDELKNQRRKLKPSSSYDSDFWSSRAELIAMDQERVSLHSMVEYRDYRGNGGLCHTRTGRTSRSRRKSFGEKA
jgi:hypothetical protein